MTYLSQTLRTLSLAALPVMSALPAQAGATSISEILYGEIAFPKAPTIELTLRSEPAHSNWDRYLTFEDHTGDRARLKVRFRRRPGTLVWYADSFPNGLDALEDLALTGNRSYWDKMYLENRGGSTSIRLRRVKIVMHYDKGSHIPIVNRSVWATLDGGFDTVSLASAARLSRRAWAGVNGTMHPAVQRAAEDLGKCGSDGDDDYGDNPKFGDSNRALCSEFVSWYYHQTGVVIDGEDFEDITFTGEMDQIFHAADRRYDYHNGRGRFERPGDGAVYTPQPGDFLARRRNGKYEHAMMVLDWDSSSKMMTVINGPWPVTLRYVPIQSMEEDGYDFRVGRIQ